MPNDFTNITSPYINGLGNLFACALTSNTTIVDFFFLHQNMCPHCGWCGDNLYNTCVVNFPIVIWFIGVLVVFDPCGIER